MNKVSKVILALGSNLPFEDMASKDLLEVSIDEMSKSGIKILSKSRIYMSPAWPIGSNSPDYFNMAVLVETEMAPFELLDFINDIEAKFGRQRDKNNQWASRSLDIDIIDFDGIILNQYNKNKSLILPHPRMLERDFVILPLLDVCPDWKHPIRNEKAANYLQKMTQNNQTLSAKPVA